MTEELEKKLKEIEEDNNIIKAILKNDGIEDVASEAFLDGCQFVINTLRNDLQDQIKLVETQALYFSRRIKKWQVMNVVS